MIRNILIGVIGLTVLGGILFNLDSTAEYVKETVTETVEVHPDWATDTEAVEAAQAVIRKKALVAELNALEANFEATEAQYEADKATYLEKKEGLEKEIGSF